MAWLPLITALSTAGISRWWDRAVHISPAGRGIGLLFIALLVGTHTVWSVEATRAHTTIDQITADTYVRTAHRVCVTKASSARRSSAVNEKSSGRIFDQSEPPTTLASSSSARESASNFA